MCKAVFLDRDGVLLKDKHLISKTSEVELFENGGNAIAIFRELGFKIFLVTNQSVVARGILALNEMLELNTYILKEIQKQNSNALFDDIFICPHHPKATIEAFRINCDCRKPKSGMLMEAAKKFDINLKDSFIIGDRLTDIYAGKSVGCRGILLKTGSDKERLIESDIVYNPDWLVPDMAFDQLITVALFMKGERW